MESFLDDYANLGVDLFDEDDIEFPQTLDTPIDEPEEELAPYVLRSQNYWQQVPVPPDFSLAGTNVLAGLDDETLLTMSPTLLVHIQRSEASNGLQVVSPRMVTLGGIAARTGHKKRTPDMLLVGSAASRNLEWPVVRVPVAQHLFYGEPIDSYPSDPSSRPKTVSTGLVPSARLLSDPVTRAFLAGRALVDLQRRSDVGGSAEALASVLARCWSIDRESFEDMAEASLAPMGALLRYAIRADDVYPTINAPVQARKCISVAANATGRQLYGEHSGIDWRRLRVLAEAVFYQSSRLEGYTLADMALTAPPGNPRAPPDRSGILQMRPLPGSVWTFDPETFRLDIVADPAMVPGVRVPQRVRDAVASYHEVVRPIATAAMSGMEVSFSRTLQIHAKTEQPDAIVSGYRTILKSHSTFQARGRTPVAAVRNFVYQSLSESVKLSAIRALWLVKYMQDTIEALNLTHLLDDTTSRHVAARMSDLPTDLRARLGTEAGRRGSDLAEWWEAFSAQLPDSISKMSEGSASWSIGLAHLLLHPPTDKWVKLTRAMAHASHTVMARSHLMDVRLPALIGSADRSFQAGLAVARQLGESYGAYYAAMHDVACVLSARMKRGGNEIAAEKLHLAGLMWDIRAKVASTVSLHSRDNTSTLAGEFRTLHGVYHLTTAPYPAYHRWHRAVNKSTLVAKDMKVLFPHHSPARVSEVFMPVATPLFLAPANASCRLFRYAKNPGALAKDIELTLSQICSDVQAVMKHYDDELAEKMAIQDAPIETGIAIHSGRVDISRHMPAAGSYWDLIAQCEPLTASDLVDAVTKMDDAEASEIESAAYANLDELKRAVWGVAEVAAGKLADARDAVV